MPDELQSLLVYQRKRRRFSIGNHSFPVGLANTEQIVQDLLAHRCLLHVCWISAITARNPRTI